MQSVYDGVMAFNKLLNTEYNIILGKKGKALEITLRFAQPQISEGYLALSYNRPHYGRMKNSK